MGLRQRQEPFRAGGRTSASLHPIPVVNIIKVEVCDVADPATVAAIRETVGHLFCHLVGAWHVRLSAVGTPDRWDLRIRGAFGRHVALFLAAPDLLVEGVERRLRGFLRGVVPPLSVTPSGPVLVRRSYDGIRRSPFDRVA